MLSDKLKSLALQFSDYAAAGEPVEFEPIALTLIADVLHRAGLEAETLERAVVPQAFRLSAADLRGANGRVVDLAAARRKHAVRPVDGR